MAIRLIIDTNILISLEDSQIVDRKLSSLLALLQTNGVQVLVHPSSIDDLNRSSDPRRRQVNLSKLEKYKKLESPPSLDLDLFSKASVQIGGENDVVDCTILTALAKDAVHFLITEDRRLISKACRIGCRDRVLTVEDASEYFSAALAKKSVELPNLENITLHQIRDNLTDDFFSSLRSDYPGFDNWFIKCCQEGREARIVRDSMGALGALCIYKTEVNPRITDSKIISGNALKLCTLKVESNVRGQKIGELFLKAAFRYATENELGHIFITAKPKQSQLIEMLEDFGFYETGVDANDDVVFVKSHPVSPPEVLVEPLRYHINYAPHFAANSNVGKFLVPILPEYHEQLFPDQSDRQLRLFSRPLPGNAIKLAYLCNANVSSIKSGDILIFYRSRDLKACTTLGIVETAERLDDADIILERVLKRTVYTRSEIESICSRRCLVLLFRLQGHFRSPISFDSLEKLGIQGPIQTIRKISDENFRTVARLGQIEGCISPN